MTYYTPQNTLLAQIRDQDNIPLPGATSDGELTIR